MTEENLRKQIEELETDIAVLKEKILEQLRTERNLSMKKMDLEWHKIMLETEAKDRKMDNFTTALTHLSATFAGSVSQKIRQLGKQQAAAWNLK